MKALSVLATSILLTFGTVTPSIAATTQGVTVQNKVDMSQAISIAKQQNVRGKLKSIEYDADDSEYEVEFASTSTKYKTKINARTGAVKSTEQERIESKDIAKYRALNATKTNLVQAVQIATRNGHGQVVEAEFDIENNKPVYELETLRNNQKYKIVIDASSGKIIHTERD